MLSVNANVNFIREGFTPICPFDSENNRLDPSVSSDHTEIALKTPEGRTINSWNISNPEYHCYFKYGAKPPFFQTHMYVEQPYKEGKLVPGLEQKIERQVQVIRKRFLTKKVSIQVIVEGYSAFFKELSERLNKLGAEFKLVSLLDTKAIELTDHRNITGILVNLDHFDLLNQGLVETKYHEEQDGKKEKDLALPYARLRDKLSQRTLTVVGVHIPGCGSQYPKSGLETLASILKDLWKRAQGTSDVIALGDYNTPPFSARTSLIGNLEGQGELLEAPYPTHVNPLSQAANYDQIAIIRSIDSRGNYVPLAKEELSSASIALIESIERSRELTILPKS